MPIDIYSTRAQLRAIELFPREYSFLYDLFVRDGGMSEDDKAIFDFFKGRRIWDIFSFYVFVCYF